LYLELKLGLRSGLGGLVGTMVEGAALRADQFSVSFQGICLEGFESTYLTKKY
jgi:hypothetical protein